MNASALENLKGGDAHRWANITKAASLSRAKAAELATLADDLLPTDEGSLVIFGSLAQEEYTVGSDLDWTILIDSRADSSHLKIVHTLRQRLEHAKFKTHGPTEVFGGLVFSHDLVHSIGGDEDTNKNMTRRLLLLLESMPIGPQSSRDVHDRILSAILSRYVEEDANFIINNHKKGRIPRFLLNDVVRFWRTMAVDYANKYRARAGQKWALRNIKLRMSRKLIFVSGFLMCLSWALDQHDSEDEFVLQKLVGHLQEWTRQTPLESLAKVVRQSGPSLTADIFDNYNAFLAVLSDDAQRKLLEDLSPEEAYNNNTFLHARDLATEFDIALTKLLFESNEDLTRLVKKYGVF